MRLKKRFLFLLLLFSTVILIFISTMNRGGRGAREVEGWHRNRSRNIKDYVSENLQPHVLPQNFCSTNNILLVMIMSKPNNFQARMVIRETWAQNRDNVSFVFLLGETKEVKTQTKLELEIKVFSDIIQENFLDHYNNLTLKTVYMLKLFNRHCSKSHKYLMKVDDDVFLNMNPLMEMLSQKTCARNILMGKLMNNTEPYRSAGHKWYVPYDWFPEEKYPDYLCGPAYLMSADVARKLYRCTLKTPLLYIEDVYLTGICAKKINLAPQDHSWFSCIHLDTDICLNKDLFVWHLYNLKDMRYAYRMIVEKGCDRRRTQWRDWIFFFNIF